MKAKKGFYYRGIHAHGALYEMIGHWNGETLEILIDNDDMWVMSASWEYYFKHAKIEGFWEFIHE